MPGTRRRGTVLEDAILEAGWDQLLAAGYAGLTFEAVAERSRTGKAAVYRRWPDKESLMLAVLARHGFGRLPEVPDTGSLREDTLALLRAANRFGDSAPALLSTVLGAYFDETRTTPAQLRHRLLGEGDLAMNLVVGRAVERGEVPDALPPFIVGLPFSLFRQELFMNLSRVPEERILEIVDLAFLPLAHRGALVDTP